jgi:hypothetical protein
VLPRPLPLPLLPPRCYIYSREPVNELPPRCATLMRWKQRINTKKQ